MAFLLQVAVYNLCSIVKAAIFVLDCTVVMTSFPADPGQSRSKMFHQSITLINLCLWISWDKNPMGIVLYCKKCILLMTSSSIKPAEKCQTKQYIGLLTESEKMHDAESSLRSL